VSNTDAFDLRAVRSAIEAASPDVVIDQLTLASPPIPADILKSIPDDTRLHREGGAQSAGRSSGAWRRPLYFAVERLLPRRACPDSLPTRNAKLRYDAPGAIGGKPRAPMGAYEDSVLSSPPLDGVVLRYGFFYGPGTWYGPAGGNCRPSPPGRRFDCWAKGKRGSGRSFTSMTRSAATVASLTAEPGGLQYRRRSSSVRRPIACWLSRAGSMPRSHGAISVEDALEVAGAEAVYFHTDLTGAANSRAKAQLEFAPRPLVWKSQLA